MSYRKDLIKLSKTNRNLRPHIKEIIKTSMAWSDPPTDKQLRYLGYLLKEIDRSNWQKLPIARKLDFRSKPDKRDLKDLSRKEISSMIGQVKTFNETGEVPSGGGRGRSRKKKKQTLDFPESRGPTYLKKILYYFRRNLPSKYYEGGTRSLSVREYQRDSVMLSGTFSEGLAYGSFGVWLEFKDKRADDPMIRFQPFRTTNKRDPKKSRLYLFKPELFRASEFEKALKWFTKKVEKASKAPSEAEAKEDLENFYEGFKEDFPSILKKQFGEFEAGDIEVNIWKKSRSIKISVEIDTGDFKFLMRASIIVEVTPSDAKVTLKTSKLSFESLTMDVDKKLNGSGSPDSFKDVALAFEEAFEPLYERWLRENEEISKMKGLYVIQVRNTGPKGVTGPGNRGTVINVTSLKVIDENGRPTTEKEDAATFLVDDVNDLPGGAINKSEVDGSVFMVPYNKAITGTYRSSELSNIKRHLNKFTD